MINIGIVDYGAGNIASVMKAVEYAGGEPALVADPDQLDSFDKLVLPGVGASGQAIEKLRAAHLDEALTGAVRERGKPLLGICVGMQLLAEDMYEFGHYKGLGWTPGKVISLQEHGVKNLPVPHMGWSDVNFEKNLTDLEKQLGRHKNFYFAHSYTLAGIPPQNLSCAVSYGGVDMVAGIGFDTVRAFQFHPEKSQVAGEILMQWFLDWEP